MCEEDKQRHEEVNEIRKKLEEMMSSKSLDETVAVDLLNTLIKIPMSVD